MIEKSLWEIEDKKLVECENCGKTQEVYLFNNCEFFCETCSKDIEQEEDEI